MKLIEENISIIQRIKKGDQQSLNVLFHAVYPLLCAYANTFLHDRDEAEEIAQDVFYKLWMHRHNLDESRSLKSYLFTSVKNNCIKLLEHQKVKNKHKDLLEYVYVSSSTESPHENFLGKELEAAFAQALEKLPTQARKIFQLSREEGLTYQEIASKLNISQKTVETQMSRALHKLRLQLKDYILVLIFLQN